MSISVERVHASCEALLTSTWQVTQWLLTLPLILIILQHRVLGFSPSKCSIKAGWLQSHHLLLPVCFGWCHPVSQRMVALKTLAPVKWQCQAWSGMFKQGWLISPMFRISACPEFPHAQNSHATCWRGCDPESWNSSINLMISKHLSVTFLCSRHYGPRGTGRV